MALRRICQLLVGGGAVVAAYLLMTAVAPGVGTANAASMPKPPCKELCQGALHPTMPPPISPCPCHHMASPTPIGTPTPMETPTPVGTPTPNATPTPGSSPSPGTTPGGGPSPGTTPGGGTGGGGTGSAVPGFPNTGTPAAPSFPTWWLIVGAALVSGVAGLVAIGRSRRA
jgi:hypothetical protein